MKDKTYLFQSTSNIESQVLAAIRIGFWQQIILLDHVGLLSQCHSILLYA